MSVSFSVPMQRATARARRMLFTPFALEKWLAVGFAAFLSEWLTGGWGHNSFTHNVHRAKHIAALSDFVPDVHEWVARVLPWWPLIGLIVAIAVLVAILFQWLGARGKFVFLDQIVRERAAIAEPWRTYGREGNSLFVFRLVYWMVMIPLVIASLIPSFAFLQELLHGEVSAFTFGGGVALSALLLVILGLGGALVMMMLDDFVTPLMYRHRIGVGEAWRRFLPLFSREWPSFVFYALIVLIVLTALRFCMLIIGISTCCVGFVLMGAPYVGQVVLLPVYVFFRSFGPEFLAQFGPDYDVFATAPVAAPAPVAPPAPDSPTA